MPADEHLPCREPSPLLPLPKEYSWITLYPATRSTARPSDILLSTCLFYQPSSDRPITGQQKLDTPNTPPRQNSVGRFGPYHRELATPTLQRYADTPDEGKDRKVPTQKSPVISSSYKNSATPAQSKAATSSTQLLILTTPNSKDWNTTNDFVANDKDPAIKGKHPRLLNSSPPDPRQDLSQASVSQSALRLQHEPHIDLATLPRCLQRQLSYQRAILAFVARVGPRSTWKWRDIVILRIHIDKSLDLLPVWHQFLGALWGHPKIEWVRFRMTPALCDVQHPGVCRGLVATLSRFHALFDKSCAARVVCLADMDAIYSDVYFAELNKFARGRAKVLCFSSLADVPIHGTLVAGSTLAGAPRGYYFRAGLTVVKGKLPLHFWRELGSVIQNKDTTLLGGLRLLDAYKAAMCAYPYDGLYEDFEYGYDELVLNWWLTSVVPASKVQVVKLVNQTAVYFVKKRLLQAFRWNASKTDRIRKVYDAVGVTSLYGLTGVVKKCKSLAEVGTALRPAVQALAELYIDQRLVYLVQNITPQEEASYLEYADIITAA